MVTSSATKNNKSLWGSSQFHVHERGKIPHTSVFEAAGIPVGGVSAILRCLIDRGSVKCDSLFCSPFGDLPCHVSPCFEKQVVYPNIRLTPGGQHIAQLVGLQSIGGQRGLSGVIAGSRWMLWRTCGGSRGCRWGWWGDEKMGWNVWINVKVTFWHKWNYILFFFSSSSLRLEASIIQIRSRFHLQPVCIVNKRKWKDLRWKVRRMKFGILV